MRITFRSDYTLRRTLKAARRVAKRAPHPVEGAFLYIDPSERAACLLVTDRYIVLRYDLDISGLAHGEHEAWGHDGYPAFRGLIPAEGLTALMPERGESPVWEIKGGKIHAARPTGEVVVTCEGDERGFISLLEGHLATVRPLEPGDDHPYGVDTDRLRGLGAVHLTPGILPSGSKGQPCWLISDPHGGQGPRGLLAASWLGQGQESPAKAASAEPETSEPETSESEAPAETGPDTTPGAVLPVVAEDRYLPTRAHPTDAGLDLVAAEDVRIAPGSRVSIRTGVQAAIPEGYVGYITPRSGLAADRGVTVLNAPGTIDSGYRGEIRVLMIGHGGRPVMISRGDRIAQLVIHPIITPKVKLVDSLPATERGAGGFGSTGV